MLIEKPQLVTAAVSYGTIWFLERQYGYCRPGWIFTLCLYDFLFDSELFCLLLTRPEIQRFCELQGDFPHIGVDILYSANETASYAVFKVE
jgi:hypothetical protein